MTFKNLGLSPELISTIEQVGYSAPTPVQKESIPAVLQGQDLLVCAQTGTGKTASFLLPMIDVMHHSRSRQGLCSAIVLVPTRELAIQVLENFNTLSAGTSLKAVSIVGGEVISTQERQIRKGVDMIIATPGRLLDLYDRGKLIFTHIKMVVLDEADRMLDMGFMPEVDRILSALPKLRQTLLFSATVADEIKKISTLYQIQPKEIKVKATTESQSLIEQKILKVTEDQKRPALLQILSEKPQEDQAIIFCNRKRDISGVVRFLSRNGHTTDALHGDMSQRARNETLDRFRQNQFKILVTSDVAARGIDITGISLVINHDVPIHEEDYVHRIGRTGRAGQEGVAITFVLKSDGKYFKKIESLIKKSVPEITIDWATVPQDQGAIDRETPKKEKRPRREASEGKSRRFEEEMDFLEQDSVVGFGKRLPAFMLIDPLVCLGDSKGESKREAK